MSGSDPELLAEEGADNEADVLGSVLLLICRQLDRPLTIETFEERKTLQKLVYIAQRAGVSLGYGFRWHLSGPYSRDLSRTYHDVAAAPEVYERIAATITLKAEVVERLQDIREVLGEEINDHELLEAMAAELFLRTTNSDALHRSKPAMPGGKWETAARNLEALNIVP